MPQPQLVSYSLRYNQDSLLHTSTLADNGPAPHFMLDYELHIRACRN